GERLAGDRDVDVLRLYARQGGGDDELVGVLVHVQRRRQLGSTGDRPPRRRTDERVLEEPIHRRSQGHHLPDRIPSSDVGHDAWFLLHTPDFGVRTLTINPDNSAVKGYASAGGLRWVRVRTALIQ